jgi:hypothetical protein
VIEKGLISCGSFVIIRCGYYYLLSLKTTFSTLLNTDYTVIIVFMLARSESNENKYFASVVYQQGDVIKIN